ncbi:uncharacterized protein LOC114350860 [Ostrinia furnacalis]|uniref:uncharacterized protein LOC114350860 n=1 Tax=Ostrinia furnacalis TaxID=93504 RepID=UPI00103B095D|nr:uncharacterized protein LOC114350860 [Ostrinia furnacalis]
MGSATLPLMTCHAQGVSVFVSEESTFSYVDPRQKLRTVDYVADKDGFHPLLSDPLPDHPTDSEAVARAKDKHYQLYAQIAQQHYEHPHPDEPSFSHWMLCDQFPLSDHPTDSEAVARAKDKHYQLYAQIAQQHYEHPHPDESPSPTMRSHRSMRHLCVTPKVTTPLLASAALQASAP